MSDRRQPPSSPSSFLLSNVRELSPLPPLPSLPRGRLPSLSPSAAASPPSPGARARPSPGARARPPRSRSRFDSKRFCRECRRNVIREFKELKELKRMRREPRCTSWFCVADTAFECEVFENSVIDDWRQSLSEADDSYHHFEWAIGTDEGESDVFGFEDVGMNAKVHRSGINLDQFEDYFITLRAWRLDGHYTELCVKAHALKGQSCVHHRLVVGDGFVTITKGESIRSFFEHAEEAEEEDEDDAMDRDGNDLDGDGFHPQKHAKSPELARELLLDAAAVIFKEQVQLPVQSIQVYPVLRRRRIPRLPSLRGKAEPEQLRSGFHVL